MRHRVHLRTIWTEYAHLGTVSWTRTDLRSIPNMSGRTVSTTHHHIAISSTATCISTTSFGSAVS